ncbi:MAG: YitT family protein [Clostridiales bacterium]|jgi:uncharacterized membrane-anchored protein YitT (DUF2179 family)|nr:YitT family protein [Clostridiales bacterium]
MKKWEILKDYLFLLTGTFLTALAFNFFLIPHRIAPGGFSGIATVVYHLFHIPVGITILLLNIPVFIIGVKEIGGDFGIKTIISTILLSAFIDFVKVPSITEDSILASIYGGVLMGLGLGLVFRGNATTGGTDLLAKIIHKFCPFIGVGWILFTVDFLVVLTAAIVFGSSQALYALVSLYLSARIMDLVLEGINAAKAFVVISDNAEEISRRIISELERGVTFIDGQGAYTRQKKNIILCVVNRMQVTRLKTIINEVDPMAFVLVTDVREVMGEGFSSI